MSEITYISNGIATTIHDDGTKTSSPWINAINVLVGSQNKAVY